MGVDICLGGRGADRPADEGRRQRNQHDQAQVEKREPERQVEPGQDAVLAEGKSHVFSSDYQA